MSFLGSVTSAAQAESVRIPMIAVACEAFQPRASTFDCAAAHAVREGSITVDSETPDLDRTIMIRRAYLALSYQATEDCGGAGVCRGAYGVIGYQCIAIAQSAFYAGFGSFMGRETTQAQAEATALYDCQEHVGQPGAPCQIVISRCPAAR